MTGLRELEPILSRTAINYLKPEMHAAQQLVESGNLSQLDFPERCPTDSYCATRICLGLPCRHQFQTCIIRQCAIPYHLIHPRWFLDPRVADEEHPRFRSVSPNHYLSGAGEIHLSKKVLAVEQFRAGLPTDHAEAYALRFAQVTEDLEREFVGIGSGSGVINSDDKSLAIIAFASKPKETKRAEELRKKQHGRAMARLLSAHELAEIEARKRKRALTLGELPSSTAPARLEVQTNQVAKKRSIRDIRSEGNGAQQVPVGNGDMEIQAMDDFENAWFVHEKEFPTAGTTQESAIDLCELDTQENQWADMYIQN
ncbi:hypothetical protein K440DRAFT_638550 [Wilcoxina mikolae CBS 423.85]|nr:hypothetical protein K440DRAFT_638550 [Wilcoxina mikolae CBS 423.85]